MKYKILLTFIFVTSLILPSPRASFACSCAAVTEYPTLRDATKGDNIVFVGEVGEITTDLETRDIDGYEWTSGTRTASVKNLYPIAKADGELIDISTHVSGTTCDYALKEGERYLIYATPEGEVSLCSNTKLIANAYPILESLGVTKDLTEEELLSLLKYPGSGYVQYEPLEKKSWYEKFLEERSSGGYSSVDNGSDRDQGYISEYIKVDEGNISQEYAVVFPYLLGSALMCAGLLVALVFDRKRKEKSV